MPRPANEPRKNDLILPQHLPAAKLPDKNLRLQQQIDAIDRQIDRLVYELYGLTEEEIRIVEQHDAVPFATT